MESLDFGGVFGHKHTLGGFNATEFNRKHRPLVPSPAIVGSSPPTLPAEHASLSLHADQGILPPQLRPSPSSGRPRPPSTGVEWRSVGVPIGFFSCWWGTRACSDWVVHFVILFCGVLFLFWTPKSKSFVLPGMEFVLRGWLLLHSISFFICIISAALLICSHGNVKPFQ